MPSIDNHAGGVRAQVISRCLAAAGGRQSFGRITQLIRMDRSCTFWVLVGARFACVTECTSPRKLCSPLLPKAAPCRGNLSDTASSGSSQSTADAEMPFTWQNFHFANSSLATPSLCCILRESSPMVSSVPIFMQMVSPNMVTCERTNSMSDDWEMHICAETVLSSSRVK